jgi:hypothetical protein
MRERERSEDRESEERLENATDSVGIGIGRVPFARADFQCLAVAAFP